MKAWAARSRFQAGTNMRAWTFIILRNLFLSQMRRSRFTGKPAQSKTVRVGADGKFSIQLPLRENDVYLLNLKKK